MWEALLRERIHGNRVAQQHHAGWHTLHTCPVTLHPQRSLTADRIGRQSTWDEVCSLRGIIAPKGHLGAEHDRALVRHPTHGAMDDTAQWTTMWT